MKTYEPTEAEIKETCRQIQAEWSPDIEMSRRIPLYRDHSPNMQGIINENSNR